MELLRRLFGKPANAEAAAAPTPAVPNTGAAAPQLPATAPPPNSIVGGKRRSQRHRKQTRRNRKHSRKHGRK